MCPVCERYRHRSHDADHLIANLRATFKCIQEAGLKLTMHKCHFGAKEIDFLGRTITPKGVKPQKQNVQNFLDKTKFPKSFTTLFGIPELLQELCPKTFRTPCSILQDAEK